EGGRVDAHLPEPPLRPVQHGAGHPQNAALNSFARRCGGTATGTICTGNTGTAGGCPAGQVCLPIPCTSNADCAGQTQSPGFTSCGQRTSGAFTSSNIARTIVETGAVSGELTTGVAAKSGKLGSVF